MKFLSKVFVGTSGYYFRDWIGTVYPEGLRKTSDYFKYYIEKLGFRTVELNFTFYRMPDVEQMRRFSDISPEDFVFSIKANRIFTHKPFIKTLNKDEKENLRFEIKRGIEDFKSAISPVYEKGKLSVILFQFPLRFSPDSKNFNYLSYIRKNFSDYNIAFEFRNELWASSKYIEFLRELKASWVIADLPKVEKLLPFIPVLTHTISYVRLHGRNCNWYKAGASLRYDYNYSDDELENITNSLINIFRGSEKVYIYFNNCHNGQAALNAIRFREILENSNNK